MWSKGASCVWSATSSTLIICPEAADCLPMTSLFTLVLSAPTELRALSPSSWTCSGGGGGRKERHGVRVELYNGRAADGVLGESRRPLTGYVPSTLSLATSSLPVSPGPHCTFAQTDQGHESPLRPNGA